MKKAGGNRRGRKKVVVVTVPSPVVFPPTPGAAYCQSEESAAPATPPRSVTPGTMYCCGSLEASSGSRSSGSGEGMYCFSVETSPEPRSVTPGAEYCQLVESSPETPGAQYCESVASTSTSVARSSSSGEDLFCRSADTSPQSWPATPGAAYFQSVESTPTPATPGAKYCQGQDTSRSGKGMYPWSADTSAAVSSATPGAKYCDSVKGRRGKRGASTTPGARYSPSPSTPKLLKQRNTVVGRLANSRETSSAFYASCTSQSDTSCATLYEDPLPRHARSAFKHLGLGHRAPFHVLPPSSPAAAPPADATYDLLGLATKLNVSLTTSAMQELALPHYSNPRSSSPLGNGTLDLFNVSVSTIGSPEPRFLPTLPAEIEDRSLDASSGEEDTLESAPKEIQQDSDGTSDEENDRSPTLSPIIGYSKGASDIGMSQTSRRRESEVVPAAARACVPVRRTTFGPRGRGSKAACYSDAFKIRDEHVKAKLRQPEYDPYDIFDCSDTELAEMREKLFPNRKRKTTKRRSRVRQAETAIDNGILV